METHVAKQMLDKLCRAAEQRDGTTFATYFTDDGSYHDSFYGEFAGRERIAQFINDSLYRHATELRWDMFDPAVDGDRLYARYIFSYKSTLPEADGARAIIEGVAAMALRDGKISRYDEIINAGTAFADLNFAPERIFKLFIRQSKALRSRPEANRHISNGS